MNSAQYDGARLQPDLENCDKEPIHIPGAIQPQLALLARDEGSLTITHASENLAEVLGVEAKDVIGKSCDDVLSRAAMHEIGNAELASDGPSQPGLLFGLTIEGCEKPFDVVLHQHDGRRIIELQPDESKHKAFESATPFAVVQSLAGRVTGLRSREALWNAAAQSVRSLMGFGRVMIYRFAEDGSGEVVAEATGWDLESFLGLRYPASDIPKQARELYKLSPIRVIADVQASSVRILASGEASERPLDLTYAASRAVSPVHIEYLRNMGVRASMSMSILIEGRLWGLIACHHNHPRPVSPRLRSSAQLFTHIFSTQLESVERAESFEVLYSTRERIDQIVRSISATGSVFENLAAQAGRLQEVVRADGFALVVDGSIETRGEAPPDAAILELRDFLVNRRIERPFATHTLPELFPPIEPYRQIASGVLAIPFARSSGNFLLFFRKELTQIVTWAGDPHKAVSAGLNGDRLTPRKSFEAWKEERRGQSAHWTPAERLMAETLRVSLLEAALGAREALVNERSATQQRQNLLISELNHRVKNILALMSALVARSHDNEGTIDQYAEALEGRIRALAFAHDHITRRSVSGLRLLLESEAEPFLSSSHVLEIDGPSVTLDERAFPILALVVHEMMTNAAKYGALSGEKGGLEIRWTHAAGQDLHLSWRERGGPPVQEPTRRGFGSMLIERNIPFELSGGAQVRYAPAGMEADFRIPGKYVSVAEEPETSNPRSGRRTGALHGKQVLLVEDQLMIALNAQKMLQDLGAPVVDTAADVPSALELLERTRYALAVLDVNLGSHTSLDLAAELRSRGILFVFATGYSDSVMIPPEFRDITVVRKPYSRSELDQALGKVLEAASQAPTEE